MAADGLGLTQVGVAAALLHGLQIAVRVVAVPVKLRRSRPRLDLGQGCVGRDAREQRQAGGENKRTKHSGRMGPDGVGTKARVITFGRGVPRPGEAGQTGRMAARRIRTDHLIAALGVAVLVLGALVGWRVFATQGVAPWETPPQRRALQQVRERFGPTGEVRLIERGRGPVVCGYAGRRRQAGTVAFVSRPNRILFADDPLSAEFRAMVEADCPNLPTPPARTAP